MRFLSQLFAKVLNFFVAPMPAWAIHFFATALAWLWWDVLKLRRFTVYKNISIVFPKMSKADKQRLAKDSLVNLSLNFIYFLKMPSLLARDPKQQVTFHGFENYERAAQQNLGVLFLSLHLGHGDMAMILMQKSGIPLNVISKVFKNQFLNDFWFGQREETGLKFIPPHSGQTAFEIMKALKRKEAVVFVIDQFMSIPYGIETTFFGRKTGTAYGLALFAQKTKAPVVPTYTYRDSSGMTHVAFLPVVAPEVSGDRDLQILQLTEQYNRVLEKIILMHPEQWMWVHRRWKRWG